MQSRWIKPISFFLCLVLLTLLVHQSQQALDRSKTIQFESKQPIFLPNGNVLKWMSMGYRGMVADALWIQTVLYFGRRVKDHDNPYYMYQAHAHDLEHFRHHHLPKDSVRSIQDELHHILFNYESEGLVDFIYPMLDRVTTLDPYFVQPYIFGGVYVLMDTGEIDASLSLLEKGKKYNPTLWQFPFYLGWVYWMYKNDIQTAHMYLLEALGKPGCPVFVQRLVTSMTQPGEQMDATTLYLKGLYHSTDNPEIKKRILEVLTELQDAQKMNSNP